MRSGTEVKTNLDVIAALAQKAADEGVRYVLTPEMSVAFAENKTQLAAIAEPFEGNNALKRCAEIARKTGIYLHIGSLAIAGEDGKFLNRSVLFRPDGEIAATYDKIHLFDANLPGERAYMESATYAGGDHLVWSDVEQMRLGLSICYDMRFAQLYADLALGGAGMIAVPAAFTVPTGQAHWHVLLRSRAIETGCYVLAAAQGGLHQNGRYTFGHSLIIDPWGRVLAEKNDNEPGLIYAEIDLEAVTQARDKIPALANRRPYSLSVNRSAAE